MADTIPDDAVCCFCEVSGLVVACDGCNRTMHWWCNDEDHQPTAGDYYCKDCSAEKGITNKPHAFLRHTCLICFENKPADQFVKTVPECSCHVGNNRSCALCVYKVVHTAEGDASKCRCPSCRATFTKFVLPPTANSAPQETPINPTSAVNDDEDHDWVMPDAPRRAPAPHAAGNSDGFAFAPELYEEEDDDDDDEHETSTTIKMRAKTRTTMTSPDASDVATWP